MSTPFKLQIKGLVRFSYPSDGGFRATRDMEVDPREFLYDRARLERRFALFEQLTLPSLQGQTDTDYTIGFLIGDDLPDWAMTRLQDSLRHLPAARIVALPGMQHMKALRLAFAEIPDAPEATHTATIRLDDDDAVATSLVAKVRAAANGLLSFRDPQTPFALAFNRGYYLSLTPAGNFLSERYEKFPMSAGTALITPAGQRRSVYSRNHRQLGQYFDLYSDISTPMFLRSVHRDNDSDATPMGRQEKTPQDEIEAALKTEFNLSPEGLAEL